MARKTIKIPIEGYKGLFNTTLLTVETAGNYIGAYGSTGLLDSSRSNWIRIDPKNPERGLTLRPHAYTDSNFGVKSGIGNTSTPRGIYSSFATKLLLEVWDTNLWSNPISGAPTWSWTKETTTAFAESAANGGPVGFADGYDSSGVGYCFVAGTGKSMTIIANQTVTEITDGDYPSSVIPTPVFMDGYIFVAQQNSNKIYNSSPGDPYTWQATTYIAAEEEPDQIVGLARHQKYVVAFGSTHTEFFYNAGIPSPNSPLLRKTELKSDVGCLNRGTISKHNEDVYFFGRDAAGVTGVFKLSDTKISKISTSDIDLLLTDSWGNKDGKTGVITDWSRGDWTSGINKGFTTAYVISMMGRPFYVICPHSGITARVGSTVNSSRMGLAYDILADEWIELRSWQTTFGGTGTYMFGGFPYQYATINTFANYTSFSTDEPKGATFLQPSIGIANGFTCRLSEINTTELDVGASGSSGTTRVLPSHIVTPLTDFGTPTRKRMVKGTITYIGNYPQSPLAANVLYIMDNNETTYGGNLPSTSWTIPAAASSPGLRVIIPQMGSFYQRRFVIRTEGRGQFWNTKMLGFYVTVESVED